MHVCNLDIDILYCNSVPKELADLAGLQSPLSLPRKPRRRRPISSKPSVPGHTGIMRNQQGKEWSPLIGESINLDPENYPSSISLVSTFAVRCKIQTLTRLGIDWSMTAGRWDRFQSINWHQCDNLTFWFSIDDDKQAVFDRIDRWARQSVKTRKWKDIDASLLVFSC